MYEKKPIGIFDSGVGGLSIGLAIKEILPSEDLLYFADLKFSPYGMQPRRLIEERSEHIVNFLIDEGCKAVVVACNTATVNSISKLRAKFTVPIIGVEPGIKPAALQSKTGVIGVLATEQTLNSESYQVLAGRFSGQTTIVTQACPKFVDLVENLNHAGQSAIDVAAHYIAPLLSEGCDHIVLGCTHFSFLKDAIREVVGSEVVIIDTPVAVAKEVARRVRELESQRTNGGEVRSRFWTNSDAPIIDAKVGQLWGDDIVISRVEA